MSWPEQLPTRIRSHLLLLGSGTFLGAPSLELTAKTSTVSPTMSDFKTEQERERTRMTPPQAGPRGEARAEPDPGCGAPKGLANEKPAPTMLVPRASLASSPQS